MPGSPPSLSGRGASSMSDEPKPNIPHSWPPLQTDGLSYEYRRRQRDLGPVVGRPQMQAIRMYVDMRGRRNVKLHRRLVVTEETPLDVVHFDPVGAPVLAADTDM